MSSQSLRSALPDYESFFDNEAVIRYLCRRRVEYARKAHFREYFDRLAPAEQVAQPKTRKPERILDFMPPRSRWIRAPEAARMLDPNQDRIARDLSHTVRMLRERRVPNDLEWIAAQDKLVEDVQRQALAFSKPQLKRPAIRPMLKRGSSSEYRVLADYKDADYVSDVLISQCSRYLRHVFDPYFLPCSYAFRTSGVGESNTPSHHDAFEAIAKFWRLHETQSAIRAHVAECDLQGFFDTISHQVVMEQFDREVEHIAQQEGNVDPRSRSILEAFLQSYSYNHFARPEALAILKLSADSTAVKCRDQTVGEFYPSLADATYGIPQGGALSVFIANLLLHQADISVMESIGDSDAAMYARYCDDMLIVGLDKDVVGAAMKRYIETLEELKLKHHKPVLAIPYNRNFWQHKSKMTYAWGKPDTKKDTVPWLAFVGYQLRYDGMARIRPDSVKRELDKQVLLTRRFMGKVLPSLKDGKSRRSTDELIASLEARLRASAIGRRPTWDFSTGLDESPFSWCAGFRGLASTSLPKNQSIARAQLRNLDRGLGRQLGKARCILRRYENTDQPTYKLKKRKRRPPFHGKARSYAGQLD